MKTSKLFSLVLLLAVATRTAKEKPNFLVLFADDMGSQNMLISILIIMVIWVVWAWALIYEWSSARYGNLSDHVWRSLRADISQGSRKLQIALILFLLGLSRSKKKTGKRLRPTGGGALLLVSQCYRWNHNILQNWNIANSILLIPMKKSSWNLPYSSQSTHEEAR